MQCQLIFLVSFAFFTAECAWILPKLFPDCPDNSDYDKCRIHLPCNPKDKDPCGCPHACCAPSETTDIAKGSSQAWRLPSVINHTSLHEPSYYCYLRGGCGSLCGGFWPFSNHIQKCGCGVGLSCSSRMVLGYYRCVP